MSKVIFLSFILTTVYAAPGYDFHGFGPIVAAPPIYPAPIIKTPIIAQPPIFHAPVVKTIAPVAPVIKTVAPATSYATVAITHSAPIVKTILAPQPILKSYYPAPLAFGHGYH
ncbi:uncharacterized protein LOC123005503 [Tribolium madens]|uniref:uncharacterized protein LOC123005503 n=1 Tax=Tribolium madens TaxID=41895 RepID=UPI001CF74DF4|nr:uncharacterized protein LOC123005503 [Tribolium madens]